MRNSAGLFIIMEPDKAVLLCARRAYRGAASVNTETFLEKISIPRGHRDCTDAKIYETAVREFVEETGRFSIARSFTSFRLRCTGRTKV
jgi:8-oxo-dGTP pyrophosphatase MutT (NUDIX family)